jgi:hypothetical protein
METTLVKPQADEATHRQFRDACRKGDVKAMEAIYSAFVLDSKKVDTYEKEELEELEEKRANATKEERAALVRRMDDFDNAVCVACRRRHYDAVCWAMQHFALPWDNLQLCAVQLCENSFAGDEAELAFLTWFCNRLGKAGSEYRYFADGALLISFKAVSPRYLRWLLGRLGTTIDASERRRACERAAEDGRPDLAELMRDLFATMPIMV